MAGQTKHGKWWLPSPSVQVDLKGVSDDANFSAHLQSPEEEHYKLARQLWKEKQINEELPGQIINLRIKEALLQHENSNLESEIQQLKLHLQILPEAYEDHWVHLQKKLFEEEMSCLEMKKLLKCV